MKSFLRSLVPISKQVPVKYLVNRWRNQLEAEIQLLPFLTQHGGVAVDIGGNRGQYAYALWRLGSKVEVFEPNPVCSQVLDAWASCVDSVTVHTVGLSDKTGEAMLHIPVDDYGVEHDASASLSKVNNGDTRDEIVPLSALDEYSFGTVDFVKIDVEGHEYYVLKGGATLFQQQRPSLLIEIEQRHNERPIKDIFELVQSWGYRGFFLKGSTLVSIDFFEPQRDQKIEDFDSNNAVYINNFLFLSEDRIEQGCFMDLFST